jgi:hypothetical protein
VVMVSGELVSSGSELKEVGVVASRNKKSVYTRKRCTQEVARVSLSAWRNEEVQTLD